MVDKGLEDVVQSVLEQTYRSPLVLQHCYRFDVFVDIDSYEAAPDIRNHDDGKEIGHTGMVTDMEPSISKPLDFMPLNIVSTLPPQFVHLKRFLCITVRDKDLQFGCTLLVLDFRARQVTGLSINVVDTVKMFASTQFQVVEQPAGPCFLAMPVHTEVLSYPDMVVNASCVQIAQPFASNELTVSHQVVDGVFSGTTNEPPTSSILSWVLELPRLSIILDTMGKAIPS